MTEAELLLETPAGKAVPAEPPEAPHSWDPAGRNIPAAKMDWTECLRFRQVRGIELSPDPDRASEERGPFPET
jgi:hypothetical protein